MNTLTKQVLALLLTSACLIIGPATAHAGQDDLLSARTTKPFDETLSMAGEALEKHGFTVAHVQKCDGGLHAMGYETGHYRVIFFGRLEEVRELSKTHPQLIPLFPFKLAVYADNNDTVISVINPAGLGNMLQADPVLKEKLRQWKQEFKDVLNEIMIQQIAEL
ncbi:MAG: Unknown protein [uncultured Thiotrichaceae bacterium]|uniref:DUF302 domain-containing protein n=1 Tax=uncultured Thiotrichaceae bacterium TaxID=298394 RepID=A0A6S6SNK7_9GAMM|nr:MAG: Unknown protein [uncultured Thiotrichaceae bacterium]